ncbi:MAG: uroporphyrinogen-III synthase [Gammaproteobacteria bacterium]|jgi:uroporphyrinogen-III synthase
MAALQPLKGLRIIVTRPAHQAGHLCELIRAAGAVPLALPVLAVEDPEDLEPALAVVRRLHEFDIAIFVSANAVEKGMTLVHHHGGLPAGLRLAAVGQGTATSLLSHGVRIDIQASPPYNSEALLAAAELQTIAGRRIVIFRGVGGRELLADTLRRRGARVSYAEVYRRVKPDVRLADFVPQTGKIDIVMVTSQDGLRNLVDMADVAQLREWLLNVQLVTISPRVARLAKELGFRHPPLTAAQASDEAMVAACAAYTRT